MKPTERSYGRAPLYLAVFLIIVGIALLIGFHDQIGNWVELLVDPALTESGDSAGTEEVDPTVEGETIESGETPSESVTDPTESESAPAVCAHPHTEAVASVAPTCLDGGLTEGTRCLACGEALNGLEAVPRVDHSYENEACIWCGTVKRYCVRYVCEKGLEFSEQSYLYGEAVELPDASVLDTETERFVGWFTESGTQYTAETAVTSDVTLYARFDPYVQISDLAGLLSIADAPDKSYILTKNVDGEGVIWETVAEFSGMLNGNGYEIRNVMFDSSSTEGSYGLFALNSGTVKNLTVRDFAFTVTLGHQGEMKYGIVAAENRGTVTGIDLRDGAIVFDASRSLTGASDSSYIVSLGSVVGKNSAGKVERCTSDVTVDFRLSNYNDGWVLHDTYFTVSVRLGGIVGQNLAEVNDCAYLGSMGANLSASVSPRVPYTIHNLYFGGLVGINGGGAVRRSYANTALVCGASSNNALYALNNVYFGGLTGGNYGSGVIEQCYSAGEILSTYPRDSRIGGLVGENEAGASVKSCYSTCRVDGEGNTDVGGFVGINHGIVQNSYAAGEIFSAGGGNTGGFVGRLTSSGSISKSYAMGDVECKSGSVGHFAGAADGILLKCYFVDGITVMRDGIYLPPSATESEAVGEITFEELWNEDFLMDELYWEENGWIISLDENPMLSWEMENGHDFSLSVVDPTCEYGGFTVYSCNHCARFFVKDYKEPTGHILEAGVTVPATCSAEGYTLMRCTVDGCGHEEKTEKTARLPHTETSLRVTYTLAPTCLVAGKTIYYCADCRNGDIVVAHEPLGHKGVYLSTSSAPSCTKEGTDLYFCTNPGCGEYEVKVKTLDHTVKKIEYLAPSCGRSLDGEGNAVYAPVDGHMPGEICSVCNTVLSGCEMIPAHSFALTETVNAAKCLSDGTGIYVCSDCQFEKEDRIPATGHTDRDADCICDTCGQFTFTTTPESEFTHISDLAGLDAIRSNLNGYYILDADIVIEGDWTPIGTRGHPFKGVLYGAGHVIKGLGAELGGEDDATVYGLLGYNRGTVVNVNLGEIDLSILNASCVFGGIAAYNAGDVIGCALVGRFDVTLALHLEVKDYVYQALEHAMTVGGIVGINEQTGQVLRCSAEDAVYASLSSETWISAANVKSFLTSLIYSTQADSRLDVTFAAIVGRNKGLLDSCRVESPSEISMHFVTGLAYKKGTVNAFFSVYAADLVGYNSGTVRACSATGSVYSYDDGYEYLNQPNMLLIGKLCRTRVEFLNHSELSSHRGILGGNEGRVE